MERVVLHCDANSFYANCELVERPALCGLPFAVCGSTEERHGIVLAATKEAKAKGVKTAMVNWEARQWCPELITVPPNYQRYIYFSKRLRALYEQYTDRVEPFGLDECWLDITKPGVGPREGLRLADQLRGRVREELGLTISVGISFNKVFAKLGSDLRKPDASTLISRGNFRQKVWPLPVEKLLGVGERVRHNLAKRNIRTIGDLAIQSPQQMEAWIGKMGITLQRFAAGEDTSPVSRATEEAEVKSVGNSITSPQDMHTLKDAHCVLYAVADSVASRLREMEMRGKCVSLMVRDAEMRCFSAQKTLDHYTAQAEEMVPVAMELIKAKGLERHLPYRSLGLSMEMLQTDRQPVQTDMLGRSSRLEKLERLSQAVDEIHLRFGVRAIERGLALANPIYNTIIPRANHLVHPDGFMK